MEYYIGMSFEEKGKAYKKLDAAERAAEKQKAAVFDENGEVVKDYREAPESQTEPPQATMTNNVPDGVLEADEAGNVPTYDADGNQIGTATPEEVQAAMEACTEMIDGVEGVRIAGKIRRKFKGSIRVRNKPSWSNDAVIGATTFTEKAVTHMMQVDDKPMYRTLDGYFISGDPELVEYVEE
uniref:Uncharacterized protein n=1 Tax=Myoviridae sp. ctBvM24 TaxID=2825050 RepID=A0A8S5UD50_9CAUD|nr:MAG TPA: hypothetical protein [Myoviridae sp. ctBvM24]